MRLHPDFIIIGAPRSGTTFLYDLLIQHPDIYLRKEKRPEPHFFALESKYNEGIHNYYEAVFPDFKSQKLSGEASTITFYCLNSIKRIKAHNPDIKLILLLREPVSRMVSEYIRSVEIGREKLSFEEALTEEENRSRDASNEYTRTFEPAAYKKRGLYAHYLRQWFEVFNRDQFYIGLTENLIGNTYEELKKIFGFLCIDSTFKPETSRTDINSSNLKVTIPFALEKELKTYFLAHNKTLEKLSGINLEPWY